VDDRNGRGDSVEARVTSMVSNMGNLEATRGIEPLYAVLQFVPITLERIC
jgi:hypothetical protein